MNRLFLLLLVTFFIGSTFNSLRGDDWPTHKHDNHRSGHTEEQLDVEKLVEAWAIKSPVPPSPAWGGPAKWDAYSGLRGMRSMRNYDPVFHVISVGDHVYFGSSIDDAVRCIDATSGKELWRFTCDAPVRLAPTHSDGKIYFGSDDGFAYCLDATTGEQVWRFSPTGATSPKIVNNGRLISFWPCRTGVLVEGGRAYFANSLLPWKPSYLTSLDALTGKPVGEGCYVKEIPTTTLEGSPLASSDLIIIPQGRIPPQLFDRATGKSRGTLDGGGGCFVLLTDDEEILHAPGNKDGWITRSNSKTREKIASYPKGNAIVVVEKRSCILTDSTLSVIDRTDQKKIWQVPCELSDSMIVAGDTIFVGGRNAVAAFSLEDGSRMWDADVDGRVFSIAAANRRLLVSTDSGQVLCFDASGVVGKPLAADQTDASYQETSPETPVSPFDAPGLLSRWVFQKSTLKRSQVKDQTGASNATVIGDVIMRPAGSVNALALDGVTHSVLVAPDHSEVNAMPTAELTAEAWVRIDRPTRYGGIVGAIQDNGEFERGWLLGYGGNRFSLALTGSDGNGRMTYLNASQDFTLGGWHHVVGTYDGVTMKVFVDGKESAASSAQKGSIFYPPQAFYEIGAYHDKDEYFRMAGMLREVRVYDRALDAAEIAAHHSEQKDLFPPPGQLEGSLIAIGPYLRFDAPGKATVRWQTKDPSPTILSYRLGSEEKTIQTSGERTSHVVEINDLAYDRIYHYRIGARLGDKMIETSEAEIDTYFNYSRHPVSEANSPFGKKPEENVVSCAKAAIEAAGRDQGICIVYGSMGGELAYEIARNSDFNVVVIDDDQQAIEAIRLKLRDSNFLGSRISCHHVSSMDEIPFTGEIANLIVSGDTLGHKKPRGSFDEVIRLLVPGGGVVAMGMPSTGTSDTPPGNLRAWLSDSTVRKSTSDRKSRVSFKREGDIVLGSWRRPGLPDSGEWSHLYGSPDNSGYGGETLQGARSTDQLEVQWIGRPGPRYQADRSGRKPSPLAAGGRLYMQGLNRIIAVDSFNGTILWSLEIPHFQRFNMPRDCSNWCADEKNLYIAVRDRCWRIDGATGEIEDFISIPGGTSDHDWGYLARHEDLLIGSAVKRGSSHTEYWWGEGWYDAQSGPATHQVCSDLLFAYEVDSDRIRWQHSLSLILNPTITIGDDHIYFVESEADDAKKANTRRIALKTLGADLRMSSLKAASGKSRWQKRLEIDAGKTTCYLAHGNDTLVIVTSADMTYRTYAFDDGTGKLRWHQESGWLDNKGDHGTHMSRPGILANSVVVRPVVFDLRNGKKLDVRMPSGGCGTYAASSEAFFFRSSTVTMWDPRNGKSTSWNRLRPDCWVSTIPADGLLLSPEGGGGCSCGNWMETSLAFKPKKWN